MLRGNRSQSDRSGRLSQSRSALVPRLHLFAFLAVLGPLFAGLNVLVLESVPQVEVRFVSAESTAPAPDPVFVDRVVERVVYVPIDNLPAPETAVRPDASSEAAASATSEPVSGEAAERTEPEAIASEPEAEAPTLAAPVAPWRAPVVYEAGAAEQEPAEDAVAEEPTADEAPVAEVDGAEDMDQAFVAATPHVIVVHTMLWDGEQYVESADEAVIIDSPELADPEANAGLEPEPVADAVDETESAAENGDIDGEPQFAKSDDLNSPAESSEPAEQVADAGNEPEQAAEATDEPEQAAQGESEAEAAQLAEGGNEPDQVAEDGGELEQVDVAIDDPEEAVEFSGALTDAEAATRARRPLVEAGDEIPTSSD